MNTVKYPCRNCVYFKQCGDNMRTAPCVGRKTKSEKKREEHQKKLSAFLFAMASGMNTAHNNLFVGW